MPEAEILQLDAYRERRDQRLRLATSLYVADSSRSELLQHLSRVACLLGADRAATVWIDEYGPGLVHPYVVLDLLSDRPRRSFPSEPLRKAWESGVPGLFEASGASWVKSEGTGWTMAVALGSDGTRSWFLVADAVTPRQGLTNEMRDRIMFLAGECSAVVLHRDLDSMMADGTEGASAARPRFAGWPILQDIEGREEDEDESRLIALRFLVARLPRLLVDDDLTIPLDRLRQQADRAREEVNKDASGVDVGSEGPLWDQVLDAFQDGALERLGRSLLELGRSVEQRLHLHGAVELYQTAYELFAATGAVVPAVDAARFAGRALRRLARWGESFRWYGIARQVADAAALPGKVAVVLDGMANAYREKGNLPLARSTLEDALAFAEESGDPRATGTVYHGLAGLDHHMGQLADAVQWAWRAVEIYPAQDDRVMALASLGGILIDVGALGSAADAWTCAFHLATNQYYRLYAADALGHIAALQGDRAGFERWSEDANRLGWETSPPPVHAEILLYRGLSYQSLGEPVRARDYLSRAVRFAEQHGLNRTLFTAETALENMDLPEKQVTPQHQVSPASLEVSTGLQRLRLEVVGAGVG